jgi:hypothetical protein
MALEFGNAVDHEFKEVLPDIVELYLVYERYSII